MIEVVTSRNALIYRDALDEMFRLRHRALVDGLGIERLRRAGGLLKDRFDTASAIHLLLSDEEGAVRGAVRLLPTTGPHVLSEVLPHWCAMKGVPRDAKTLELSRLCIDPALNQKAIEDARNRLMVGLLEFVLRVGYERLTLLIPTDVLYRHLLIGLDIKPLGLAGDRDGRTQIAVVVEVTSQALAFMRLALDVHESEMHYVGAPIEDALVLHPLPSAQWPVAAWSTGGHTP